MNFIRSKCIESLSRLWQIADWRSAPRRAFPHVVKHLRKNPHGPNLIGSVVVSCALAFLYVQTQPITAGSDPAGEPNEQVIADTAQQFAAEPLIAKTGIRTGESTQAVDITPKLVGKEALLECDRILGETEAKLSKLGGYAATFVKQERVAGTLSELQVIQFRMSHGPTKVMMKWQGGKDDGQRVLYSEGENEGDMLVRKAKGFEARLGVLSLNPEGAIAMKYSRYPVTQAGLLQLTKIIRLHRAQDLKAESGVNVTMLERQSLDNREAITFTIEYDRPELSPDEKHEYRKLIIFIDNESRLPVCIRGYGWPDKIAGAKRDQLDQTTLIELYAYKNVDLKATFLAEDFSKAKLQ